MKSILLLKQLRWLILFSYCIVTLKAEATVRRVDAGATTSSPNGLTWASAYSNLQTAINASASGDTIWIAAGTYQPASGSSFVMKEGVKVYGGFITSITAFIQRDWKLNIVHLKGNNARVINNSGLSTASVLDGVTIENGSAASGAGVYNSGASPTIKNVIIQNNTGTGTYPTGGGMYNSSSSPQISNTLIRNNTAALGGGIYNNGGTPKFYNVVIANNTAPGGLGGGLDNESSSAEFYNCIFYGNTVTSGNGAGIYSSSSNLQLINCTIANNSCAIGSSSPGLNQGSAVYNQSNSSLPIINNCVIYGNTSWNGGYALYSSYAPITANYCYVQSNSSGYNGTGNVSGTSNPFLTSGDPIGPDNTWMTADDGLQLSLCSGSSAIDKGDNSQNSLPTDITGQPRKFDVPLIANGGSGTSPIIDMGAYESQITTTPSQLAGVIGNGHVIPYKQELKNDYITSATNPITASTYRWEQSSNLNTSWVNATIASPTDSAGYRLPDFSGINSNTLPVTYSYRRVAKSAAYCNAEYTSNIVQLKVVYPVGQISGYINTKNGAPGISGGINGDTVIAKHSAGTNLQAADTSYIYYGISDQSGHYTISNIFVGDPDVAWKDTFNVVAIKENHRFDPNSFRKELKRGDPQSNVNFRDTTVLSVTGRTYQQCISCLDINNTPTTIQCPIDSVAIWKNGQFFNNYSTFIGTAYGRYNVSVTDPGTVNIEPRFPGHVFSPAFTGVTVNDDVAGVDFQDITTHTISGRLSAGCGNNLGTFTLEFTDTLPNDASGNPRSSCFRKKVSTDNQGYYTIVLPARKYKMQITDFVPSITNTIDPAYVYPTEVIDFVNNRLPADSLTRNITTKNDTLNIVYERKPVLQITGLTYVCNQPFALMQQGVRDSFLIKVFQGPAYFNCPVHDTSKIRVFTSVQADDNSNEELRYPLSDTGVQVKLKGGTPWIITPFYKVLNVQFTDKNGRSADMISKNVVVTGVKTNSATFTTVSPEVPLLILHDPPGDNSFSYWQQNQTKQTAMKMYAALSGSTGRWAEVKVGTDLYAGLGVIEEAKVWGSIRGQVNVAAANTTGNEAIVTTTTQQYISTDATPSGIGSSADVYMGMAMNLIYAKAIEIKYNIATCKVDSGTRLIIANTGFATQYIYSERQIKSVVIPSLQVLAQNTGNTAAQTASYNNQIHVWQQVLDNNAANKARAAFDKNISFDGGVGPVTNSTTTSVSKTSTVEFNMSIEASLAAELGFEVGGSGASGGVNVAFKMETGSSGSVSNILETTTGYTLNDDDTLDYFSVDVKKDPVYSTPVFQLKAGTASCPNEEGTQPRDEMQFTIPVPANSPAPENTEVLFTLKLGNTSQSMETRKYLLSFDQASNPNGAIVTIGGSQVSATGIPYTIAYGGEIQVTVSVKKPQASSVYSFEGLTFILADACGSLFSKSASISAYFQSECSAITLGAPENGWVLNTASNNILPVLMKDYDNSKLTGITLQYSKSGLSNWSDAFTKTPSQLNSNGTTGTSQNWNVTDLPDGEYNLRLKLSCSQGTVFSGRSSGIIDRKAPSLFGKPTPSNDVYINGDIISFSYSEKLNTTLNNLVVTLRRLSNNTLIPVTVSNYDNRIVIVPSINISGFTGDSMQVIVSGIVDTYGNVKATSDTSGFIIGISTASSGTNALTLSMTNTVVYKNTDSAINVMFNLPVNVTHDTRINYTIGGTARMGTDYTIVYPDTQPNYSFFNGSQGSIRISNNTKQAILKIKPVNDTSLSADKTITISLSEGGDYVMGSSTTATGTITSEDNISVYTFTGNGNFNVKSNWLNNKMPLTTLAPGKEIIIDPSGICNLNVPLTIKPMAKLTIKQNKQFIIQGSLKLQ